MNGEEGGGGGGGGAQNNLPADGTKKFSLK